MSELDDILSSEDDILPSSGFSAAVMEAVRRAAAEPPPLPFPWLRALPGILGAVVAVILCMIEAGRWIDSGKRFAGGIIRYATLAQAGLSQAEWTGLALLLAAAALIFSTRLARNRA